MMLEIYIKKYMSFAALRNIILRVRIYRSRASSPPLLSVVELLPPKKFESLTAETVSAVAIGELEASQNVQGPPLQAVSINRALDGVPLGRFSRCLLQQSNQLNN